MLQFHNEVKLQIVRNGVIVDSDHTHNGIVNEGKIHVLNTIFRQQANNDTRWYIGLISGNQLPVLSIENTLANNAWSEFQDYDEANRILWVPSTPSYQPGYLISISNINPATFTINKVGYINGILLASSQTKGEEASKLWATAPFNKPKPVSVSDLAKITYILKV